MTIRKSTLATFTLALVATLVCTPLASRSLAQSQPTAFEVLLEDIATTLGSLRDWLSETFNDDAVALRVELSQSVTIPSGSMGLTEYRITFDHVEYDTHGFIDPQASPGVYTLPEDGFYEFNVNFGFNENNIIGARGIRLWNGSKVLGTTISPAMPNTSLSLSTTDYFNAGDTVTVYAAQDSGQSIPSLKSNGAASFTITKVGD